MKEHENESTRRGWLLKPEVNKKKKVYGRREPGRSGISWLKNVRTTTELFRVAVNGVITIANIQKE